MPGFFPIKLSLLLVEENGFLHRGKIYEAAV
jgi:hypothetical protein